MTSTVLVPVTTSAVVPAPQQQKFFAAPIAFDHETLRRYLGELWTEYRRDERQFRSGEKKYLHRRDNLQWEIGDVLLDGRRHMKVRDLKKVAHEATGQPWGTLKNYLMVSKAFPASRRRDKLSWSHHRIVKKFNEPVQEQLLDRAVAESRNGEFSVSKFRNEIKRLQNIRIVPTPPDPFVKIRFRVPGETHKILELVLTKNRDLHGKRRVPDLIWWLACQSIQHLPTIKMTCEEFEAQRSGSASTETKT